MKHLIESILQTLLSTVNRTPERLTDKNSLRNLMRRLAPVETPGGLVRLGPATDGGYLVPDDLDGIEACFSPGVSFVSGFEKQCAERGMKVFLADGSVDGPADDHDLFSFTKNFIGSFPADGFLTLDGWVEGSLATRDTDLMLQIDIEGFEYEVFLSASAALMNRFRVIVVEFHTLDKLFVHSYFKIANRVFEKILSTHACVHIHPNNVGPVKRGDIIIPPLMEFTFIRRDRLAANPLTAEQFPHPLDADCTDNPRLVLPSCWRG